MSNLKELQRDDVNQALIQRVTATCRRCAPIHRLDHEQIAIDIIVEALEKHLPLTFLLIKNRTIDALRKLRADLHDIDYLRDTVATRADLYEPEITDVDQLNVIMQHADLTLHEKEIIYLHYYKGKTFVELAQIWSTDAHQISKRHEDAISRLRTTASTLRGLLKI